MKLEGSLDAFSLPDVFQLLSYTKKTGGLHLSGDKADGVVYFAGGEVTGASADESRQPLARRLVGGGAVDDDALAGAVEAARSGERLGVVRALLEHGAVDGDLLRRAAKDQAVDAVFDLLRWPTGDFSFAVDETNPDDVGVTLPTETVLADAEARTSTWETVSTVVPSSRAVLAMPVVLPADPAVSREEWSLLALVDGRRTVGDLVDLTGSGQYAVVSTLAGMVKRGLLEVRPPAGEGEPDQSDHVAVVVRRQRLLAPLETVEAAAPAPAPAAGKKPDGGRSEFSDAVAGSAAPAGAENGGKRDSELVTASAGADQQALLGGAHRPDGVVPPRPEPYLPARQADFDESGQPLSTRPGPNGSGALGNVLASAATAPNLEHAVIERDPDVNRSLMLRLIAGVRGL